MIQNVHDKMSYKDLNTANQNKLCCKNWFSLHNSIPTFHEHTVHSILLMMSPRAWERLMIFCYYVAGLKWLWLNRVYTNLHWSCSSDFYTVIYIKKLQDLVSIWVSIFQNCLFQGWYCLASVTAFVEVPKVVGSLVVPLAVSCKRARIVLSWILLLKFRFSKKAAKFGTIFSYCW